MTDKLGRNYVPKVGDIVNVTLRDAKVVEVDDKAWRLPHGGRLGAHVTVTATDNGQSRQFFVQLDNGQQTGRVTVELVKPAAPKWPTAPGSVIGYKSSDSKYVRLCNGYWQSIKWPDEGTCVDEDFSADWYEVLFDAGAVR